LVFSAFICVFGGSTAVSGLIDAKGMEGWILNLVHKKEVFTENEQKRRVNYWLR